jgi:hypothetical protein
VDQDWLLEFDALLDDDDVAERKDLLGTGTSSSKPEASRPPLCIYRPNTQWPCSLILCCHGFNFV